MDAIKHLITPGDVNDNTKWANMRRTLNVTRAYLHPITDASTKPRHGQAYDTPQHIADLFFERSWTVMNRYFHYIQLAQTLPLDQFPLLDDPNFRSSVPTPMPRSFPAKPRLLSPRGQPPTLHQALMWWVGAGQSPIPRLLRRLKSRK